MNKKILASAIVASALLSASLPALADWGGYQQDQERWSHQERHDWDRDDHREWREREHDNDRWRQNGWHDNGWHGRKDYRDERIVTVQREYVRGAPRPYYEWNRGQRLPVVYRQREYYVNDWRTYRLYEPPRGYRWVRVNGDYILVSVISNVIAQILLGH